MPSYTTDYNMEEGHFGGGADHGNANTTEFPLDFGEMLLFQPGPQQAHQFASSLPVESAFAFPPSYSTAPAPTFDHLPEETLPNLRPPQFPDHLEFKPAGPGLRTSMGRCTDVHRASNFGRATFQYVPEKSSLVHITPESSPYMIPGYQTSSCSPGNSLKRVAGCEMASSHIKLKRPTDQAEHILRERVRRDDMTSKFRMLESLIPPGAKRDRATIIEESIRFVKNLHHRLKDLQKKRSEMKSSCTLNRAVKRSRPPGIINKVAVVVENNTVVSSPSESNDTVDLPQTCIEKVEVHMDLPHEIVIEMTCRSHGRVQSQILVALERLQMDVLRCSISKLHGRIVCVFVVKPQVMADPPMSSDGVIRALKRAVAEVGL